MSGEKRVKDFLHVKQDLVVLDFFSEKPAPTKRDHIMTTAAVCNEDLKETRR
jgi:hypothetical protein